MKRAFKVITLILFALTLSFLFIRYVRDLTPQTQTSIPNQFYKSYILGGFSIDTPEMATKAVKDNIQVAFEYGQPPSNNDALGQKLQSLHMKVVDGYISSYLYYYECHRTKELKPSLIKPGQYCQSDPYPYLTNANVLLATIAAHLEQVKANQLIIGYWVLDDWIQWDAGSARQILIKIHDLLQKYTPGRPAICGFGGNIGMYQKYGWEDWVADNFSQQGCDEIAFYIYAPSLPDTAPMLSSDAYDWSMTELLPAMFASLQRRGWTIAKEPFIGIGQAFGGPIKNTNRHWITPTARDIEIQSRSFCAHGATGLAFYAWNNSGFGPDTQTPMNSSEIEAGIQRSVAACKAYWAARR